MTATAAMILQVRGWANEPDDTTYDDDAITVFIERYPLIDERGELPYTWDTSDEPPSQDPNDDWIDTYDLHAAAADIWTEKATVVAGDFDFQADGGNYSRNQVYQAFMGLARYHAARRKPGNIRVHKYPAETAGARELINL
jgi:hypothetical protein